MDMAMFLLSIVWALLAASSSVAGASFWDNRLIEELEHLLVDHKGYNTGNFTFGIDPCGFYFQGPQTTGRDTAGQWMRVGFHDFATADVEAGTGGLDASIGYETLRPENSGTAMNDSLSFFNPFVNQHASMADMIALGTTLAVKVCGGPLIPFKAGRIDATEGGEFGVPEPDTSISVTLAQFAHAGFSQTEAIQLTACGHTVGRVHHAGFPTVVGPEADSPNNTQGGVDMDDTFNVYDNHIVTGYLDDTTTNPLVKSFNVSSRSDLRIFSSDLNVTMKALATSNEHFHDVCRTVVSKQLNTVPKAVVLQDVAPIAMKPTNVQVSLDSTGKVTLAGDIRLLESSFPSNPNRHVFINVFSRQRTPGFIGSFPAAPLTSSTIGSSQYTDTQLFFHPFNIAVSALQGISGFTVTIKENSADRGTTFDNEGKHFAVQDVAVWMPALTTTSIDGSNAMVDVVAAVFNKFAPEQVEAVFSVPVPQIGTLNPLITPFSVTLGSSTGSPSSLYTLFKGSFTMSSLNQTAQRTTMDIVANAGDQTFTDDFRKLGKLSWS